MGEGGGEKGFSPSALSLFAASTFPFFPEKRLILRLVLYDGGYSNNNKKPQRHEGGVDIC